MRCAPFAWVGLFESFSISPLLHLGKTCSVDHQLSISSESVLEDVCLDYQHNIFRWLLGSLRFDDRS